jgi:hypothetical protein
MAKTALADSSLGEPEHDTTPVYDVMTMRYLNDHPRLQPLVARRRDLLHRLEGLEAAHKRLEAERATLEQSEAQAVAVMGTDWTPVAYRRSKEALADNEAEAKTLAAGLEVLDQEIEAVTSRSMFGIRVHVVLYMNTFMLSTGSCRASALNYGFIQEIGAFRVTRLTMILSTYPTTCSCRSGEQECPRRAMYRSNASWRSRNGSLHLPGWSRIM